MAHNPIIREPSRKVPPDAPEQCIHCYGSGQIIEPVEVAFDWFEDEASECHMCLGTGRKMSRAERIRARADLDAHHSGLERMER